MTKQKYFYVGIGTTPSGQTKLRFTNNRVSQVKRFQRDGGTVEYTVLPKKMTKLEAAQLLLEPSTTAFDTNKNEVRDAIQHVIARFVTPTAVKPRKPKKAAKAKKAGRPKKSANVTNTPTVPEVVSVVPSQGTNTASISL